MNPLIPMPATTGVGSGEGGTANHRSDVAPCQWQSSASVCIGAGFDQFGSGRSAADPVSAIRRTAVPPKTCHSLVLPNTRAAAVNGKSGSGESRVISLLHTKRLWFEPVRPVWTAKPNAKWRSRCSCHAEIRQGPLQVDDGERLADEATAVGHVARCRAPVP